MDYRSHIGQDRWVAEVLGFKMHGYFLEFGALDGVLASNCFTLEKELGWTGICVEANPTHYPTVCQWRNSITINGALWSKSRESLTMVDANGLSSVMEFKDLDCASGLRQEVTVGQFDIDTINPNDLLDRFRAPNLIDYMSMDIEGSELEVLNAIDFSRYRFGLMTIEHADVDERKTAIVTTLERYGYLTLPFKCDFAVYHPDHLAELGRSTHVADPVEVLRQVEATFPIRF